MEERRSGPEFDPKVKHINEMLWEARCWDCVYGHVVKCDTTDQDSAELECRKYPPILVNQTAENVLEFGVWPLVGSNDWCGEFVLRIDNY